MILLSLLAVCLSFLCLLLWAVHTYTITWAEGSQSIQSISNYTGSTEKNYDAAIPTGTVDQLIDIGYIRANIQSLLIVSDQNLTLKTNSSGAPTDTIAIVGGVPIFFRINDGRANLFTADVTKFFVTNASGSTANLSIRGLENP